MSDALSDGARAAAQANAYSYYLGALMDYLKEKTDGTFGRFMFLASEVPEHLRGWGGSRLDLTDEKGHEYVSRLVFGDLETWATLLRTAWTERSKFTNELRQKFSPFRDKVLLFFDSRPGGLQVESVVGAMDLFRADKGSSASLDTGKYLIILPVPKSGVAAVRADKKLFVKK